MPDISKDVKLESKTRVLIKKDCFYGNSDSISNSSGWRRNCCEQHLIAQITTGGFNHTKGAGPCATPPNYPGEASGDGTRL